MNTISGSVERITFYNQENGYTVLRLKPDSRRIKDLTGVDLDGLLTVVGNFPKLSPGEAVEFSGDYTTHPKHGLQFKATACKKLLPVTISGIERYLGSGLIKGIGPQLSKRIVRRFKEDTLEIIENDPQKLSEVPGIGADRTKKIIKAWEEQRHVKDIMLFFHEHQISTTLAVKIYREYGENALDVVKTNPYQLEEDIFGIGFKTADSIARDLGLAFDHPSRIEAGIVYVINAMVNEGHVYVPILDLIEHASKLLEVDPGDIPGGVSRLISADRIIKEQIYSTPADGSFTQLTRADNDFEETGPVVYLTPFYHSERGVAKRLSELITHPPQIKQAVFSFPDENLSADQQRAIEMAFSSTVSVITGGPGTGKTTCLKALITQLERSHLRYALVSPTGRAAKRLSEATGRSAQTIHRLLGYKPGKGFQYHDKHPLNIDFLIVDEASMLDLILSYSLLRAIKQDSQVLLVGDVDQLPSVGAGNVLRDILSSSQVPIMRLRTIFRQSQDSLIIENSHRINQGKMPIFSRSKAGDFFLFPADNAEKTREWVSELVAVRIPQEFGYDPLEDIQVITPIYRGAAGVDALNLVLQEKINPASRKKAEKALFGRVFRVGDKVMQTRNNYNKEVFNGDIGIVTRIDHVEQSLGVVFDRTQEVDYDFIEADEITLAYAVSVHKAQGSEFPVVIMPVLTQHYIMLQRNLLYTGITRAREKCVIIGNKKAIRIAINNNKISQRNSFLSQRLNRLIQ